LEDILSQEAWIALKVTLACAVGATLGLLALVRRFRRERDALVSELGAERAAAANATHLLDSLTNNLPTALLVLNERREVVRANNVAEQVHDRQMVGQTCGDVMGGCAPSQCGKCALQQVMDSGLQHSTATQRTDPRTGEVLSVDFHRVEMPDGQTFAVMVEQVITEQRKLQARLIHQEKMAAFGLLAAGIAHDMGNPLSAIAMHMELLDDGSLSDEATADVRAVRQEVGRLRRILQEMVNFARRRRDSETLVSVNAVVEDAMRLIRHDSRLQTVDVEIHADAEAPPVCMVEDHLVQVVLNLMINALDAMPDGGSLRVDSRPIGDRVALRIRDTGTGMPRQVLERCFEPLFTTKGEGQGTGLGLSICRDIVRSAGGELELHSAAGKGTTCVLTLPAVATVPAERLGEYSHVH